MPSADPAPLRSTRLSLHTVAEHVLAPARYRADGHIGLRQSPGGFATPPFPSDAGERQLAVDGTDLVVTDAGGERRAPLTTVRAAAEQAGIAPGAPSDVYPPATPLEPDRPLDLDPGAAAELADWYALVDEALERLADGDEIVVQLWPEHFDLAAPLDEVNYGGSPGDEAHPLPYLYVGPFSPPSPDGGYWNELFGASLSREHIRSVDDALAFFREGRSRLAG